MLMSASNCHSQYIDWNEFGGVKAWTFRAVSPLSLGGEASSSDRAACCAAAAVQALQYGGGLPSKGLSVMNRRKRSRHRPPAEQPFAGLQAEDAGCAAPPCPAARPDSALRCSRGDRRHRLLRSRQLRSCWPAPPRPCDCRHGASTQPPHRACAGLRACLSSECLRSSSAARLKRVRSWCLCTAMRATWLM